MAQKDRPEKEKNIHAGHRQRMRERFYAHGLSTFQRHEVMEILLFYAIPRRNTNPIGHELIKRFGTLDKVMEASEEELLSVPQIGPKSAQLIRLVPALLDRYMSEVQNYKRPIIRQSLDIFNLMTPYLAFRTTPAVFMIFLDRIGGAITVRALPEPKLPDVRTVLTMMCDHNATRYILVECTDRPFDEVRAERAMAVQDLIARGRILDTPMLDFCLWSTKERQLISFRRLGAVSF